MDKILNKLTNIEKTIQNYPILILKSEDLKLNYDIKSSDKLQEIFNEYQKEGKLLKIAIVGSVKAGKSTLLNSLVFNSKNILPKAATPMTAALTEIAYSDKFRLKVEYFSDEDIEEIKKNAKLYKECIEEKIKTEVSNAKEKFERKSKEFTKENEEKIKKNVIKKFKYDEDGNVISINESLEAANEQYEEMKKSGISFSELENNTVIEVNSLEEIQDKMNDYVGAKGKYMPFTKSTRIELNIDSLQNIEIIDTPGLNDPIISRSNRTKALLKECDVVLLISSAGSFFSNEDLALAKNLQLNQAVNEIYLIGTKIDDQLYGQESNDNNLYDTLKSIEKNLLSNFSDNSEFSNLFKGNIKFVSAMCQSIKVNYDNIKENSDEEHTLNLLMDRYKNYFSKDDRDLTLHSLETLANIKTILEDLNNIRSKKEEIIAEKLDNLLKIEFVNLNKYTEDMKDYITSEIDKIEEADIDEIKKELSNLNRSKNRVSASFNFEYDNTIGELKENIRSFMNRIINKKSIEIKNIIGSSERVENKTQRVEKSGLFSWIARKGWGGGYEDISYTVKTFNTAPVKQELSLLKITTEQDLIVEYEKLMRKFKNDISGLMVSIITENIELDNIEPSEIKSSIQQVVNSLKVPNLKYKEDMGMLLNSEGLISGYMVDRYIQEAYEYITNFTKSYYQSMDSIISDIDKTLLNTKPLERVINRIDERLEQLKNSVDNKQDSINLLNLAKNELEIIDGK